MLTENSLVKTIIAHNILSNHLFKIQKRVKILVIKYI